jgi:O-antigen/teichoic acid export membrane protein
VLRYSAANYVANALTIVPALLLPVIAIRGLGSASAGYYYISYQIANLLFMVAFAVSQSLFAEGSHTDTEIRQLARRSAGLQLAVLAPAAAIIAIGSHPILSVFGAGYASHGAIALLVLAASAPAVALNGWTSTLLRIRHQLTPLIVSNLVYVGVVCACAAWWVHRGLAWLALAWLVGNLASGVVGLVALRSMFFGQPAAPESPVATTVGVPSLGSRGSAAHYPAR